jgi:hypothetical protein
MSAFIMRGLAALTRFFLALEHGIWRFFYSLLCFVFGFPYTVSSKLTIGTITLCRRVLENQKAVANDSTFCVSAHHRVRRFVAS